MNKLRLILYKLNLLRKRVIRKSYRYIDDFDYSYPFGRTIFGGTSIEYYSDNNVIKTHNGYEFITKKEHIQDYSWWNPDRIDFDYTSGMLWSKQQYLYGSFEAEILLPSGYGLWSAFWLQGQNSERFTEVDIFEYYSDIKRFTYNTHYGIDYEHNLTKGQDGIKLPNLENSWHKYRLDWHEGKDLKFYIDDKLVGVRDGKPFNRPMNLIVNMAVKKDIGDKLDKHLPTIMQVKNIRYYGIHK